MIVVEEINPLVVEESKSRSPRYCPKSYKLFCESSLIQKTLTTVSLWVSEEFPIDFIHINSFDELYNAVNQVLSLPRPLASYIFTSSENDIQVYSGAVRTGGVVKNDVIVHFGHPNAPFGGINNSGIGNAHGYYGFRAFSHEQPVIRSTKRSPIDLFHPPYKDLHKNIIKTVIKWF